MGGSIWDAPGNNWPLSIAFRRRGNVMVVMGEAPSRSKDKEMGKSARSTGWREGFSEP